jgi:anti-anti-sigma factor
VSDGATLGISRDNVEGVDVVAVDGEVDLTNAEEVEEAVVGTTAPAVVLDLSAVSYLDSSGIRAIDKAHRRLGSEQRSLLIVSPPDSAADWTLRVAGFNRALVVASLETAVAAAAAAFGRS